MNGKGQYRSRVSKEDKQAEAEKNQEMQNPANDDDKIDDIDKENEEEEEGEEDEDEDNPGSGHCISARRSPTATASKAIMTTASDAESSSGSDEEITSLVHGMHHLGRDRDCAAATVGSRKTRLVSETGDIRELLVYPSDPRSVRYPDNDIKPMARLSQLPDLLAGPRRARQMHVLLRRWGRHFVLPSRLRSAGAGGTGPGMGGGCIESPWVPANVRKTSSEALRVLMQDQTQGPLLREEPITENEARKYLPVPEVPLTAYLGYHGSVQAVEFRPGHGVAVDKTGKPMLQSANEECELSAVEGVLFDTGGMVIDMDWAPRVGHVSQFLLMSVVPFEDELVQGKKKVQREDGKNQQKGKEEDYDWSTGCMQLWELPSKLPPSKEPVHLPLKPRLRRVICSDWGRVKRVQWCPVAVNHTWVLGMAAMICGDGLARVIHVAKPREENQSREIRLKGCIAELSLSNEETVWATCLTWVNSNRLCVGYTDGSIALWSIRPTAVLLARNMVHHSELIDVVSAYPSHPGVICSVPLSGSVTVFDFGGGRSPMGEVTAVPMTGIHLQAHMLEWCEPLLVFGAPAPTTTSINTQFAAFPLRFFSAHRNLMALRALPCTLAMSKTHPFVLAGDMAGGVWVCNALHRLFTNKTVKPFKMQVLAHEYRPASVTITGCTAQTAEEAGERTGEESAVKEGRVESATRQGAVRILTGFSPEPNLMPKAELMDLFQTGARNLNSNGKRPAKKTQKTKQPPRKQSAGEPFKSSAGETHHPQPSAASSADAGLVDGTEGNAVLSDTSSEASGNDLPTGIVQERLTRITRIKWNVNVAYGHWAAIAMASGLVRVMNLGVDF